MKHLTIVVVLMVIAIAFSLATISCKSSSPKSKTSDDKSFSVEIASLEKPQDVTSDLWKTLTAELVKNLRESGADKRTAAAPLGANGKAASLTATAGTGNILILTWRYRNTGDYDQDGEVGVPDITPIATNYLKNTASTDWLDVVVIDGDASGDIGVPDITPIANNYLNRVDGYIIETADSPTGAFAEVEESPWSEGHTPSKVSFPSSIDRDVSATDAFLEFTHNIATPIENNYYRVTPYQGTGGDRTFGEPSDPVLYSGGTTAPPAAPTGVTASDGDFTTHVAIAWTKSSTATGYKVYRDDQITPIITLGDVASYDDSLVTDTDTHTYWVKASNSAGDSDFSTSDTGYKGGGTVTLQPPTNLHASDGTASNKIALTWTGAIDATGYKIFRDAMTSPIDEVGNVETYDDTTVTDTQLHTYWVVSTDGTNDSGFSSSDTGYKSGAGTQLVTVFAYNDLGMHCMNQDFSEFMILPPYNTVHAQVIDKRLGDPQIMSSGITVHYTIPGNTHSYDKTNFWSYVEALLGASLAPDIGLAGFGLSGEMTYQGANGRTDWAGVGIPITPINDNGEETPYNLATVTVTEGGNVVGSTQTVVPVSWEISCELCHDGTGVSVGTDILRKHDTMHGTALENDKPVLCGSCHAQPELGLSGMGGLPSLSRAMHNAHSTRMAQADLAVDCYACHPGIRTQCLRDVHATLGMTCNTCHGEMSDVADITRTPWVSEPKCGDCHNETGHDYEEPGKLFRESRGHMGIYCEACHGSPHAITPTINPEDNVQALLLQGHEGVIDTCTVCHSEAPTEPFPHSLTDG